jgi:hypothetical protein
MRATLVIALILLGSLLAACEEGSVPSYDANGDASCNTGTLGSNEASGDLICWK